MRVLKTLVILISLQTFSLDAQSQLPALKSEVQFVSYESIPFYSSKKRKNSALFQGNKETKNYFEGWYFKMVAEDGKSVISVIPGVALSTNGEDQHAFIQIINGMTGETSYHTYPIETFSFSSEEFAVKIANNYFSLDRVILNIANETTTISGDVSMTNLIEYSDRNFRKRDIMGWYRKLPFLECYHGVVSLNHNLSGQLIIDGKTHSFEDGKGYIEKDWGSSMPSSWVWIQSNNFEDPQTSVMISIANVPLKSKSFNGFLGFLYLEGKVYRFGTYTPSKLKLNIIDNNTVTIIINNRRERIEIDAKRNSFGILKAPVSGEMDRRIPESIDADISLRLYDKKGNLLYSDQSSITGFELVGEISKLVD